MNRLENNYLSIEVSPKGAELMSLMEKATGREWLWQGDPQWWSKRAPNLFPFIGCLKEGRYTHEGQSYKMTKHGFARDMAFESVKTQNDRLHFVLRSSAETLAVYPFDFELHLEFIINDNTLVVAHQVMNKGSGPMYFSLGGHPAFNCNMGEEDWKLHFEEEENLETYKIDLSGGLIFKEKKRLSEDSKSLVLAPELFKEDALVFENLKSESVLLEGPNAEKLRFNFKGFPLLAFWSPMGPFLCIEPWYGMADHVDHGGELKEKYAVVSLDQGQTFSAAYSITLGSL